MAPLPKSSAWRYVKKAIHPQLPLNQRQSQQLLGLLRSSFQKHLDHVHPPLEIRSTSSMEFGRFDTETSHHSPGHDRSRATSTGPLATSGIVDQILSNALFSTKPPPSSFIFGDASTNAFADLPKTITSSDTDQVKKWFLARLASGSVDIGTAGRYLSVIHKVLAIYQGVERKERLRQVGAGQDVLQWLERSSSLDALGCSRIASPGALLITSLTAENRLEDIQKLLLADSGPIDCLIASDTTLHRQRTILRVWSQSSFDFGTSLEQRLQDYLRFIEALRQQVLANGDIPSARSNLSKVLLSSAIHFATAVTAAKQPVKFGLYESFFNTIPIWGASSHNIGRAMLYLYHPTKPDGAPALLAMENLDVAILQRGPRVVQERILKMCLDSSAYFLGIHRTDDASSMLSLAQHHFAQQLGNHSDTSSTRQQRVEERTLASRSKKFSRPQHDFDFGDLAVG